MNNIKIVLFVINIFFALPFFLTEASMVPIKSDSEKEINKKILEKNFEAQLQLIGIKDRTGHTQRLDLIPKYAINLINSGDDQQNIINKITTAFDNHIKKIDLKGTLWGYLFDSTEEVEKMENIKKSIVEQINLDLIKQELEKGKLKLIEIKKEGEQIRREKERQKNLKDLKKQIEQKELELDQLKKENQERKIEKRRKEIREIVKRRKARQEAQQKALQ
jgi:hypothetical protein